MSTILQHDAAARLVDAISSTCNDESVKATLETDILNANNNPNTASTSTTTTATRITQLQHISYDDDYDSGVDDTIHTSSSSSLEEYAGSDELSPTTESAPLPPTPLPLAHVRPALSKLTAAAQLIDRLSACYDAADAQDLLGDTNAWHSFEDYTETIDALYDRYQTALYAFSDAAAGAAQGGQHDKEEEGEVSAETYQEGMQSLAKVLRGSCDPLPYRLRQVHNALVGTGGDRKSGGRLPPPAAAQYHREVEEARVLLRAANDRCIEEADDFLAYYVSVRKLFLHLVASEAKAVMVMAVALQHGSVPNYIHPSDVTTARQLLAEQDAFLDRVIPSAVTILAERVLTASSSMSENGASPAMVEVTLQTHKLGGCGQVRVAANDASEIVCADSSTSTSRDQCTWTLESSQPLPKEDGDAVDRYTFRIRGGSSPTSSSTSPTYLECDDKGDIRAVTDSSSTGTWRIVAVQVEGQQPNGGGKAVAGAAIPVAFRLQYRSAIIADGSSRGSNNRSHGKWLATNGERLSLRDLDEESHDFLFDVSPVVAAAAAAES